MRAMVLENIGTPLKLVDRSDPVPGVGEIRLKVEACAVCRTDLHVIDGDLRHPILPLIPGHEIVGIVDSVGKGVARSRIGRRVGVPWLGHTCGRCPYCASGHENLCDQPDFTGYTRDGGFASHVIADAQFAFDLDGDADPVSQAPLLCAGLIGWRCLKKAGDGQRLGIYGFGAAAHIVAQIAIWQGREIFAVTRPGDEQAQDFARSLGATWAGGSDQLPPAQLDAAIIFAPVGGLVPMALGAVRKGGRVVCGGIHMSDIPAMAYELLWEERELLSVANLTRRDAEEFFPIAKRAQVRTHTKAYPLEQANQALDDLRQGRLSGAAVLVP
ncbi:MULTISPECIES: zinc-dependent alcohol dehydrogenase family protein [unclassified Mesorhizobium]|uniref:zinc-dependent alcohol dehydrogenase family protein n=1 Tax=unclassified Mesorhizobium TaxID=325217 RepID=UPI000F76048B|nr:MULTISPECIES: zinc-dependent alcohol dehydrogenase family protein [unclassified Mesorhizobium]AZO54681.1 zinc-binding alcohol dehydrogenase family protein [Mesorhizobium sp. M8A.F.Ca.ET.057.01.1.1]RWE44401.1 MAG: zinc-binding alcohol dehydrogenase family protein [Mesorhizobium sp.]